VSAAGNDARYFRARVDAPFLAYHRRAAAREHARRYLAGDTTGTEPVPLGMACGPVGDIRRRRPRRPTRPARLLGRAVVACRPADLEQLSRERRRDPERRLTARGLVAGPTRTAITRVWLSARSGQVAGSGGLPRGVDWVAPEVPAPLTLRSVRHLAAAAFASLGVLRRSVGRAGSL